MGKGSTACYPMLLVLGVVDAAVPAGDVINLQLNLKASQCGCIVFVGFLVIREEVHKRERRCCAGTEQGESLKITKRKFFVTSPKTAKPKQLR